MVLFLIVCSFYPCCLSNCVSLPQHLLYLSLFVSEKFGDILLCECYNHSYNTQALKAYQ